MSPRHSRFLLVAFFLPIAVAVGQPKALPPGMPEGFAALPGETVLIPALRGIVCVADPVQAGAPLPELFAGIDTARAPLVDGPEWHELLRLFLDRPVSLPSLERIPIALRAGLRARGRPFIVSYVPPQDLTAAVVRVVIHPARLEGELQIEGAQWFSEESYRRALPVAPGEEIDAGVLQTGVQRLNRNAHRRVLLEAESGQQPGTTRLVLRVQETKPWQVSAGYSNAGTALTNENRVSAGWTWGDAFGRGDSLGYSLSADPGFKHSVSHSANYGTTFASGRTLTVFGSHSTIESALPAPLTQEGISWQAGARLALPLTRSTSGWERSVNFTADFKYSDNTLEFARIPVTDNVTHVAQLGATFAATKRGERRNFAWSASLHGSPGGLTRRNRDSAFAASRAGARAAYLYGRLDAQYAQRLARGCSWIASANLQFAGAPLLGTEQLNGGGAAAVRGYRESSAFGDDGALVSNELHLPPFSPLGRRDRMDVFGFADVAVLGTYGIGGDALEIGAVGLGLDYRFAGHFDCRAAYGWKLKRLPADQDAGRLHVSAHVRF